MHAVIRCVVQHEGVKHQVSVTWLHSFMLPGLKKRVDYDNIDILGRGTEAIMIRRHPLSYEIERYRQNSYEKTSLAFYCEMHRWTIASGVRTCQEDQPRSPMADKLVTGDGPAIGEESMVLSHGESFLL